MSQANSRRSETWAELISNELSKRVNHPTGNGWMQVTEIASKYKISQYAASNLVKNLKDSGKLEVYMGCDFVNGRAHRKVWYRLK